MCRILAFTASRPLDPAPLLAAFAEACRTSEEYQGHGWGIAWRTESAGWCRDRSVSPIWDDDPPEVPPTRVCLVHARSAFRNEGIVVANNMPFLEGDVAFAFNGELLRVRLSVPGETGAARLMELLARFRAADEGDLHAALARLDAVVTARSAYVRALNVVAADAHGVYALNRFSEDPDYFTLHRTEIDDGGGGRASVVCSDRLPIGGGVTWRPLGDGVLERIAPDVPVSTRASSRPDGRRVAGRAGGERPPGSGLS